TWFSRATDCGAALLEGHLATICRKIGHPLAAAILSQHLVTALPPRSCSNMLKPFGIPSTSWRHGAMTKVIEGRPDEATLFTEGLELLRHHRKNYGPSGPKTLVVLWWEWPELHWNDLRLGGSMNFMREPTPGIVESSPMTEDQKNTAIAFVEELISLGVYDRVPPGHELRNTCPLFLVPKSGQPGQWRCIADMKRGGQNAACVADPVHLPQPSDILPKLYKGGWSSVIDASKFFHMFPTVFEERKYMGLIHPKTGDHYWYSRFPMGSANSPGASGRYGAAFLRLVMDTHYGFQGTPILNHMLGSPNYNPDWGEGRVLIGRDGLPILLIWIHVDDVFLHGPTAEKLIDGLNHVMNVALRLGLICQAAKTKPPSQTQKFCGFIYDTTDIPCMRVPEEKLSRSRALVSYLQHGQKQKLARLTLAVVLGVLQSLVPATPGNLGSTFLTRDPLKMGTLAYFFSATQL
ncbi:MAG: hypothetical protein ACREBR_02985, partial [bacterium]